MKINSAVLRVVAKGINDQLANGERKPQYIRRHVGTWLDWYQTNPDNRGFQRWAFRPGEKMLRDAVQMRRCKNGIDFAPVEIRQPFPATGNAQRLDYTLPRTPVKPERGMLTLLRHGAKSSGATILGTAELTDDPFAVKLQRADVQGHRWHDLEKPTALGHEPTLIGSLWPSRMPMFDLHPGSEETVPVIPAPRDRSKRVLAIDGPAPRKSDRQGPTPRFHMWPSRIPVW